MRIDAHHSFSGRYPLEHLESILKRNRFEGSILVGKLADTPDFVRGIVVPAAEWSEASALHPKFRGVQVRGPELAAPAPWEEWEARDVAVEIAGGLSLVPLFAARYPGVRIAIGHLGAPAGQDWLQLLAAAARFPRVWCKLSGLTMFSDPRSCVQHALRLFGPARLMFGSDWPNGLPEYSWKANLAVFTQSLGAQSQDTREEILGGTAARFYGI